MRLSTVVTIAAFVALAACDSKGPPRVGATASQQAGPGAVTLPVTAAAVQPPPAAATAKACPDPAEIIAKACPPAKAARPPAKPVKLRRHPPKPRPQVARAPTPPREYARPDRDVEVREYARVEAPPPQGRIVQEEVYESYRSYPPPMAYAPPPPPRYAPPPMAYGPPPAVYHQQPAVYAPPPGPCCTYPAAGRDANGFLTWPGKR